MKDSYYFSHDYHARSDENIIKMLKVKGPTGYGLYWMLVEMLYEGGGSIPMDYELLAYEMRVQCDSIKSVCEDFGLFYFKDNRIYSLSVDRRLAERENKSLVARNSAMKRWGNNANAMQMQCEGNAIKERKGKERKEKESKEKSKKVAFAIPTILEVQEYCKERSNNVNPVKWWDYYQTRGWKLKGYAMKDWKAAVRTWEHSEYNQTPLKSNPRPIVAPSNSYNQAKEDADKLYIERSEAWHNEFYKSGCPGCGYKPTGSLDVCNCDTYKLELDKAIESFKTGEK